MFDLAEIGNALLPQLPMLEVKLADIRIEVEPSGIPLLPVIHIEADLDIKLGF